MSENSFFDHTKYINVYYAMLPALKDHLSGMILKDDHLRMVNASNDYAFRARTNQLAQRYQKTDTTYDGNLEFPFINYRRNDKDPDASKWNSGGFISGIYVPELRKKIRYNPVIMDFECTFWCQREDDMHWAVDELRFDNDGATLIDFSVEVDGVEIALLARFSYTDLSQDPQYDQNDWLEKNRIHSIRLNFQVHTNLIRTNTSGFAITEKVLFDFANKNCAGVATYEEALEFLVNHETEQVTPIDTN